MMKYNPSKPVGEFLADLAMGFFQAVEGGDMPPVVLDVRAGKYVAELGVVLRSIRLYQPEAAVVNKLQLSTVEEIYDAVGKTFRFPGGTLTIVGGRVLYGNGGTSTADIFAYPRAASPAGTPSSDSVSSNSGGSVETPRTPAVDGYILFDYTMDSGAAGRQQVSLSAFREWSLEEC